MPDDRPETDPFSAASSEQHSPFEGLGDPADGPEPPGAEAFEAGTAGSLGASASLALQMARSWVKQHQKATMLSAFATGVFLGRCFRD